MPAVVANIHCKYSAHRNPAGVLPHVTHKVICAREVGSDVCLVQILCFKIDSKIMIYDSVCIYRDPSFRRHFYFYIAVFGKFLVDSLWAVYV